MLSNGQATDNSKTLEEKVRRLEQELEEENVFLLPASGSLSSSTPSEETLIAAEEIDEPQQRVLAAPLASPDNGTIDEMVERVEHELDKDLKYKTATPATLAAGTAASTVPTAAAAPTVTPAETKTIELIPIGKVVPTAPAANWVAPEEPTTGRRVPPVPCYRRRFHPKCHQNQQHTARHGC